MISPEGQVSSMLPPTPALCRQSTSVVSGRTVVEAARLYLNDCGYVPQRNYRGGHVRGGGYRKKGPPGCWACGRFSHHWRECPTFPVDREAASPGGVGGVDSSTSQEAGHVQLSSSCRQTGDVNLSCYREKVFVNVKIAGKMQKVL